MGVPRSSFYAAKKPSEAKLRDRDLADHIAQIQQKYFFTIGRRRMGTLLKKLHGIDVGTTRLQRVMSLYGLTAKIRQVRKAKPHAGKATQLELPPNELNREFKANKPYQRFVTDVTYVPYYEQNEWHWGYLSLVQDLFDRSIVSWVYSKKQDNALARRTLQLLSFLPLDKEAMLHSDRGSIYTANSFREILKVMGVKQSFSRTANCHDNATMECFNGTFKVEALYNPLFSKQRPSFMEQNDVIARYIDFYNYDRPCSIVGNLTPVECRTKYFEAHQPADIL